MKQILLAACLMWCSASVTYKIMHVEPKPDPTPEHYGPEYSHLFIVDSCEWFRSYYTDTLVHKEKCNNH